MTTPQTTPNLKRLLLPLAAVVALTSAQRTHANSYASGLTNNAGTISYRLNQSADRVIIVYTNLSSAQVTNDVGPRGLGVSSEALGVPGAFTVIVEKTNTAGYLSGAALQINSDATNTAIFNSPRGVAVNKNPASPYFGRIYVANSAPGTTGTRTTTGDGYFLINPDWSDAVGQGNAALSGGANFVASTDNDLIPFRLEVGEDDNLYMPSFARTNGGIYVSDPNITTTTKVLDTTNRFNSVIASGSLAGGNLVIEATDAEALPSVNRIRRYVIGSGPLPASTAGVPFTNDTATGYLTSSAGVLADLAKGSNGKYYLMQNRSAGTEAGIFVVDPADDTGAAGFSTGGNNLWDVIYSSYADSVLNFPGTNVDIMVQSRGVAISPNGQFLATVKDDSKTMVVPLLSNGKLDLANRKLLNTGSVTLGRDICFDAAGNIYNSSSGNGRVRVYSPGFFCRAITTSSGTFSVTNILPETVTIANVADASEPSSAGQFSLTRTGSTADPMTIDVVLSGTAAIGVDYNTNGFTFISNNVITVTLGAGVSTTNIDIPVIDDDLMEPVETVVLTLVSRLNYVAGGTGSATVNINVDSDTKPVVHLVAVGSGFSELLAGRPGKFRLTTLVPVGADTTVNIALTGTAASGVDYSESASLAVVITNGTGTNTFFVTPINNAAITSNRTVIASLVADVAYAFGVSNTATLTLREDDLVAGTVLFSDNFDIDSSASWSIKSVGGSNDAVFAMDYSTVGIPIAPNTTNSTTLGLRLRANLVTTNASPAQGPLGGVSVSPVGLVLPANFRLRYDLWMNYNGPMPGGGTGSSEYLTTGLGVLESRTNVTTTAGLPGSSIILSVDGDGGFQEATGDFIVYTNAVAIAANTNVYPANARDNFNAYYAEFGERPAPTAQVTSFANQTGLSQIGSLGSAWHDVLIEKNGTNVTWTIDGLRIANLGYHLATVGSNFSLGYQDLAISVTDEPQMNMAIVDNLRIEQVVTTSTNNSLASLVITTGTLVPAFTANNSTYAATNAYVNNSVTVTAVPADTNSAMAISLNGGAFVALTNGVASGAQNLQLVPPQNTIAVRVTAQDTSYVRTYTVNALLQPSLTMPLLTNVASGGNLALSWAADHTGYRLQTQTNNLNVGLSSNWFTVPSSTSTNQVTVPANPANPTVFYRLVYP